MNKVTSAIRKYTPYAILLLGIWIIVTFFIAGGVRISEEVINPADPENLYHFTIFQVMLGKKLGGAVYFKPNFLGILIVISLVSGLIIGTFNKIYYKTRHLLAGMLLLVAGICLFVLPKNAVLGNGWNNPDTVVVSIGATIIVAGTFILIFAVIHFLLIFIKEIKEIIDTREKKVN